jgi:hypothetical protein
MEIAVTLGWMTKSCCPMWRNRNGFVFLHGLGKFAHHIF